MARAKVVHSTNAVEIIFKGNRAHPEPETGVIKFPGGHVEVSRCTNGQYWAHIEVYKDDSITDSRIDYNHEIYTRNKGKIDPIPYQSGIRKMALRIGVFSPITEE